MMRQLLLGIAAAATLGAATLSSSDTAQAQSWSLTIGQGGGYHHGHDGGFRQRHFRHAEPDIWDRGHGRSFGNGHAFGQGHGGWRGRPVYGDGFGYQRPHCVVRKVRYWDGWGWVVDRRRVCN